MRTTLTYDNKLRNTRVTKFHVLHMTSVRKFIHFNVRKESVSEFISQGHSAMKSGELKSTHQSDIGAISRISNLVVNRIHLGSRGVLLEVRGRFGPTVPAANLVPFMPIYRETVGSPSQRAIYNILSSVMQITLKVNFASSILSLSPIFTLLQGSDK